MVETLPIDRFIQLVEDVYVSMQSPTEEEWGDLELTMPQLRTLLLLRDTRKRMGDIASKLGITVSSATSMIDRLVKKGLVERVEEQTDRRVTSCRLTADGEREVERFWHIGRRKLRSLAEGLTPQELDTVVHAFELLSTNVKRRALLTLAGTSPSQRPPETPGHGS